MAITYTWDVVDLETKTEGSYSNVVVQTRWTKIGTDSSDGSTGSFQGATPFSAADVPEGDFIAFNLLTKAKVLEWIQAVVIDPVYTQENSDNGTIPSGKSVGDPTGAEGYATHVNAQIAKDIESKQNPQTEQVPPWVTPSPPE